MIEEWRYRCPECRSTSIRRNSNTIRSTSTNQFYCNACGASFDYRYDAKLGRTEGEDLFVNGID